MCGLRGRTVPRRNTGHVLFQEGHIFNYPDKHRMDSLLLGTNSDPDDSYASLEAGKPDHAPNRSRLTAHVNRCVDSQRVRWSSDKAILADMHMWKLQLADVAPQGDDACLVADIQHKDVAVYLAKMTEQQQTGWPDLCHASTPSSVKITPEGMTSCATLLPNSKGNVQEDSPTGSLQGTATRHNIPTLQLAIEVCNVHRCILTPLLLW